MVKVATRTTPSASLHLYAVKMHTLLDLRGNIPSFIHISDGKLHDVHALDMLLPEPDAIYVMDRGSGIAALVRSGSIWSASCMA
jgi:hypothetical protein